MRVKSLIVICSALFAASAFAQALGGSVTQVEGIVTVTDGVRGGTATPGSAVTQGSRYVTSSSGSVTLRLDNGCVITLRPSQAITIQNRPCEALQASIEPVGGPAVAGGGTGLSNAAAMGIFASGVAGTALNNAFDNNRSISSN